MMTLQKMGYRLGLLFLVVLVPAACVVPPPMAQEEPVAPEAAQWDTWVLASSSGLRPEAPPDTEATATELAQLRELAADVDEETKARVAYWNAGAPNYRWIELALDRYSKGPPSPMVSRTLSLINVAIYDAVVAAWDAKYTYNRPRPTGVPTLIDMPASPSYPSEHAAAAGAAAVVMAYVFPDEADFFMAQAEEAAQSRVYAGVHYPSDVEAGLALGRAVGEQVVALAEGDGSDAVWDGEIPTGPGKWVGENPVWTTTPTWRPWVIDSPDDYLPGAPPDIASEQMQMELAELKNFERTVPQAMSAWMWHSFERAFPYWFDHVDTRLFEQDMTGDAPHAALIYAALSVTAHDTIIACFNAKYTYWMIRPPQLDPELESLFPSPPHPSYPAAHSCSTMSMATAISEFFPEDAEQMQAAAHDAGNSRLVAGIHYRSDRDAGEAIGKAVAGDVIQHVRVMTQQ